MNVFVAILGLGLLVLVHEAGHFFSARAVGMRPRRFYVGFPPPLVKVERNGIEYGLGAVPLGGYVKIPGMHRPAPSDVDMYFGRALAEAPQLLRPLERLKQRLAEDKMAEARAALDESEHALNDTGLSPPALRAARRGLNELRDALGEDAYWRQRIWKRILVIFAGPGTNLLFAVLLFTLLFMISGGPVKPTIAAVDEDFPAAKAGLQKGDKLIAINGVRVRPEEVSDRIAASEGRPLTLTVERDGTQVTIGPIRPRKDGNRYRVGLALDSSGLDPATATWRAIRLTGLVTREIGASLTRLVTGEGRKEISSPVGIVQGSSKALEQGMETYLWVLGLISLSLALLNLLPLLPLDGGHIVFSIVEGIRGRAVGREVYERVSAVGIALVLLLFFIGLSNDVNRLGD
ncbi:MAG TPA: M50 family metallopeptidase [Gaiellaceae bacterium]|nr:M50 family metallopeptidase [Gaiellaceae bacterium]